MVGTDAWSQYIKMSYAREIGSALETLRGNILNIRNELLLCGWVGIEVRHKQITLGTYLEERTELLFYFNSNFIEILSSQHKISKNSSVAVGIISELFNHHHYLDLEHYPKKKSRTHEPSLPHSSPNHPSLSNHCSTMWFYNLIPFGIS